MLLAYASPELFVRMQKGCGASLLKTTAEDSACDVYAFAISLYEMVTGTTAWPRNMKLNDVTIAVQLGKRPDLQVAEPKLATRPHVVSLITRGWSQDPSHRPAFSDILKELPDETAAMK